MLAEAQKWSILTTSSTDSIPGQSTIGPTSAPAVSVVVSGVDGVQTGRVEECLHEGNGLRTGVRITLLSEWDIRVEAGVVGAGYIWGSLGLKINECEGGYVDKCQ